MGRAGSGKDMNRRNLIAEAGAVAAASMLPGGALRSPMPPPPPMPNLVRISTTTRTRVGRHILLGCYRYRSDGAVVEYMAPGIVRSVTAEGRDYTWLIATDAPPEDLAWFLDCETGVEA